MQRRIAAILVGDIVGSTPQMEADEESAVRRFAACLDAVSDRIGAHEGRVFNRAGDAVLAEFSSPVNALRAAMAARGALSGVDGTGPKDMRFGLHLADVFDMEGDLRGDGVNLAARIQSAADPGAIDASGALFDQVRRNSPCVFDDLGDKWFKGVSEPIHIYRVREQMDRHRLIGSTGRPPQALARRPNSLAVPPLRVATSANEDQRFFAEGLTEDLILELGRIGRLYVTSSSASVSVETSDPVEIGRALGVCYVLQGSVRSMGSRLRLNLALAETAEGQVLWSERIQRPADELFDVMDEITAHVAATVFGRVEEANIAAVRRRPPESLTAYERYLRGLDFHRRGSVTDDNVRNAADWFSRALEADPNYGRAQAMYVCAASGLPGFEIAEGERLTAKALEMDPNDPEANRIFGAIKMHIDEFDAARAYHDKALSLAPNDAYIAGRCAAFHTYVGEPERALELLDRAETLDPFLPVWCTEERVAALYSLDRHDDALAAARSLPFQTRRSRLYRAASRMALGDPDRARRIVAEAVAENPGLTADYVVANEHYRDPAVMQTLLDRLRDAGLPSGDS
jgi:TolB-like protein